MKERILWLDNLKGVLIFLVVLGHCLQFTSQNPDSDLLFNFIYLFHMPLFMFLSGYACFKLDLEYNKETIRTVNYTFFIIQCD